MYNDIMDVLDYGTDDGGIFCFAIAYILGIGLIIGSALSITRQEQCDLSSTYHVHLYTRELENVKIQKWLQSEKDMFDYQKQDDLLPVTTFDLNVYETLDTQNLFNGEDNIDFIHYQILTNRDYMKFYYYYTKLEMVGSGEKRRMVTHTYQGWSSNPSHRGVNGRVRVFHTKYYAYKLVQNENGIELEKSESVDDIRTILNEYPYISEDTNQEVYEEFRFSRSELPYLDLEDFDPFYTPTVEDNPLEAGAVKSIQYPYK